MDAHRAQGQLGRWHRHPRVWLLVSVLLAMSVMLWPLAAMAQGGTLDRPGHGLR